MAKNKDKPNPNIHHLWPTSILTKQFPEHQKVNPVLLDLFYQHRDKEQRHPKQMYASRDNLLEQYKDHAELIALAEFIKQGVFEIAREANKAYWRNGDKINLLLSGLWFQITNNHAFHETHVHGNCSWSGVYYVRAADASRSANDHSGKTPNGITRFYGPHMETMAGGHNEYGNLYLQDHSWDAYPEDGKLVIFPSYLKHMAFPYAGQEDRVIVSFHACLDNAKGFRFGDVYSMH